MDERDVLREWRAFFTSQDITPESLEKAETFLNGLSGESPLHLRLANELADLKNLRKAQPKKRTSAAKSK